MAVIESYFGMSHLFSRQRSIQISNVLLIYDYGDRAGLVVGSIDPEDDLTEDVFFSNKMWIHGMRVLIAVLHEIGGYPFVDPHELVTEQRERQLNCERCRGIGEIEDCEGNWVRCPECE